MEQNDRIKLSEISTPPDNYLVWAILSTILCCWPVGIFAIIKSTKVNSLWKQGDTAGAQKASEDAKKFSVYAAIAGAVFAVIYIIIIFVFGMSSAMLDAFQ